jgi:hypothetical protein
MASAVIFSRYTIHNTHKIHVPIRSRCERNMSTIRLSIHVLGSATWLLFNGYIIQGTIYGTLLSFMVHTTLIPLLIWIIRSFTTAISIDYPKSPIPLIFHRYPNLPIYIYYSINQIIYCQFVIIAHVRNYPLIAREISTDQPSYQTTCRASSISMTLSRLWNSVSVRAPLVKWPAMTGFVRRWGKIGMCHQQTMVMWEYTCI